MNPPTTSPSEALTRWLTRAVDDGASDLHLVVGHPPVLRLHGVLQSLDEPRLEPSSLESLLMSVCPQQFAEEFAKQKNVDFALEIDIHQSPHRFRANYYLGSRSMGACFRVIPDTIPSFEWANFPPSISERLTQFRNGLVLISGVTGSGKTTTLAMLINKLNLEGSYRIITIEEPIEYLFPRADHSIVTQREVNVDVLSFADGLKYGLRQDPDVILVGEIRDRQTARIALQHRRDRTSGVIDVTHSRCQGSYLPVRRLVPPICPTRSPLAVGDGIGAVLSQHLLPSIDPEAKRELALEVMYNTSPIASAIRFGKLESIDNCILTGRSDGMVTLDESVRQLLEEGKIEQETAEHFVSDVSLLRRKRGRSF